MKQWVTEFTAIDAKTGELKKWAGPNIVSLSMKSAQEWCYKNAGHLFVIGELIAEVHCKEEGIIPDWDNMVDYEKINSN